MVNRRTKVNNEKHQVATPVSWDILGRKWLFPIVDNLLKGKMRYTELLRAIPGMNTRMLSHELKNMQSEGLVTRQAYATVPPTVEYSLTEKGKKMQAIVNELNKWHREWI